MTKSLRTAWNGTYETSLGTLSKGLYRGQYEGRPRAYPYRSLRALIDATRWPDNWSINVELAGRTTIKRVQQGGLAFRRRSPNEVDRSWTHEVNCITNDGESWYFIQKLGGIVRIPISVPIEHADSTNASFSTLRVFGFPSSHPDGVIIGTRHAGAGVFSRGFLYVPVEESPFPGEPGVPSQIWVVNAATLRVEEIIRIQDGLEKAPWCAINESAGLLYTSLPYDKTTGTRDQIRIYKHVPFDGVARVQLPSGKFNPWRREPLQFLGTLSLTTETGKAFPARWLQGAIVTPNNHLLLICDTVEEDDVAGLHLFDLLTGVRRWHQPWPSEHIDSLRTIPVYNWFFEQPKYDEVESVTICTSFAADALVFVLVLEKEADLHDSISLLQYDTLNFPDRRWL